MRILIVDDHPLFRQGVALLLAGCSGFEITGKCGTLEEAARLMMRQAPGLVPLDIAVGPEHGTRFCRSAADLGCQGKVLVLAAGVPQSETVQLSARRPRRILLEHSPPEELPEVIRQVMAGRIWVDPRLAPPAEPAPHQAISGNSVKPAPRCTRTEQRFRRGHLDKPHYPQHIRPGTYTSQRWAAATNSRLRP